MQRSGGDQDLDAFERIERELTLLVRRAQKVHLHVDGRPLQSLERSSYSILGSLHDEGPMRPGALAARFHLDPSTVSRQAASLEQAGLIARVPDPEDRRAYRLKLTPRGGEALETTRAARRRIVRDLLASWPTRDRELFAFLLEQFNAGLSSQPELDVAAPERVTRR